jgi:ADP-heptose:LPS heptosyltransferase
MLPRAASLVRSYGRPPAVLYFGEAPGDDLLATAVVRQWRAVHGTRPWYMTRHPQLFAGNPDVGLVLEYSPELAGALRATGARRRRLTYHVYDPSADRSIAPADTHIINLMCAAAGLPAIEDPAPVLNLDSSEIVRGARPRVIVQSSVLGATMPIRTKEWSVERIQMVVDALAPEVEVVQLGARSDAPLQRVADYRGKTSLREAAGLIAGATIFIGLVGFLMHLARAVGTPAVIVFGGREHPTQSGYPVNRNLFTELPCSPCWFWNHCPYDHECMRRISAADVIAEARLLITSREPRAI